MKIFMAILFVSIVSACSIKKENSKTDAADSIHYLTSPAQTPSGEPHLFTDKNGVVYLSWIEGSESKNTFMFSALKDGRWSEPKRIAQGGTWFVNWADYPMMATDGNGNFFSHLLDKSGDATYAYDIKVSSSTDGGENWNTPFILNDDGKQAEHGFVTLVPYQDKMFVTWLDGRNTVMEGMEGMDHQEGHHGSMSLRAALLDYNGKKTNEWELDTKTCDCCQTSAAITTNGPVVVYRDRSDEEMRDISIVRLLDGEWTKPQTVHADHWKITGCPVNGPRIIAEDNNLAVAWFSAARDSANVSVIFSTDGGATFGNAIRVDDGHTIGRVDIVMLDSSRVMVSWMEGSVIKAAEVHADGTKSPSIIISSSSESRSSGFPQMTKSGNEIIFAWTDDQEKSIKVASLSL